MKRTLISTIDRIQVVGFGALAVVAAFGVIANGAWWHIGTVAICSAIVKASLADIKQEEAE